MTFHPDLRAQRVLPRGIVPVPWLIKPIRWVMRLGSSGAGGDVVALPDTPEVSVRVFRPAGQSTPKPALLWIHGGGLITGDAGMDHAFCARACDELDAVVASVEYRLAPEHPFPTPLEDCYSALRWLAQQPDVDPERIAIGGASAGGGLTAALALLARDREGVRPVFQLLVYPMLDDRTAQRTDIDERGFRLWNQRSNRIGWRSYLGSAYASPGVPATAAPARCTDLSGLPPAWLGVGDNDLFCDEDVEYARRLREAGVDCALTVVPGAYHAFDGIEQKAPVSRDFTQAQLTALGRALQCPGFETVTDTGDA